MESQDNSDINLRVASFSAYLNSTDENFVLKLTEANQDPTSPEIFSPEETPRLVNLGRNKNEDGEIGVFGADRYFNMKIDYDPGTTTTTTSTTTTDTPPKVVQDRVEVYHMKPRLRTGITPSVSSESSWNSQAALLPSLLRNPSRIKHKKTIGKCFFTGFGCSGPCMDKKSVHVDEGTKHGMVHKKEPTKESFRLANPVVFDEIPKQSQFTFPILQPGKDILKVKKQKEEDPRYSIEVFGSHMIKKGDIATNLERKLSMLTWDAIPIPKTQNVPSNMSSGGPIDDIQSDASSDLFEIETLSGTGHPLLAAENVSGCMTPTTQYEPSEASIEWSVITASAADFSVVSDYDDKSIAGEKVAKMKNIEHKQWQKSLPGGLLGCKSHNSVCVAETAHKTNEKARSNSVGKPQQGDSWRKDFEFVVPVQRSFGSREISL